MTKFVCFRGLSCGAGDLLSTIVEEKTGVLLRVERGEINVKAATPQRKRKPRPAVSSNEESKPPFIREWGKRTL